MIQRLVGGGGVPSLMQSVVGMAERMRRAKVVVVEMSETEAAALYAYGWESIMYRLTDRSRDTKTTITLTSLLPPCSLAGKNDDSNKVLPSITSRTLNATPVRLVSLNTNLYSRRPAIHLI